MFWLFQQDSREFRDKKLSRDLLKRVLRFARPHRRDLVGFVLLLLASAGVGSLLPLVYRAVFDHAIPDRDRGLLATLALLMLGISLLGFVLDLFSRVFSARIGEALIYDLRVSLYDHVQRMPVAFFTATQTGALISRLNNDVIGAQRALTGTLGTLVSNVFTLAFALSFMLFLDWRITLLALAVLPAFVVLAKRVGRRLQQLTRQSMVLNADLNSQMTERFNVSGALLVKFFGDPGRERDDFAARAGAVRDIGIRTAYYSRILQIALQTISALGLVVVYWLGGSLAISGSISLGTIIAFASYTGQAYTPLIQLTNARVDLLTSLVSFERVFELLDLPNPITDADDAHPLPGPVRGEVRFDAVEFTYPAFDAAAVSLGMSSATAHGSGGSGPHGNGSGSGAAPGVGAPPPGPVLNGVSFVAPPGQMVALVGPSGAGKSTIVSLVPRLYDVTAGAVRLDGHDVRTLTLDSLRRAIAVVNQDPHLFHDTVRTNLRYARPDATDAEIEDACRKARIHDLVVSLPKGYDTIVGERGYRFSGGEKQRVAIARALLKDPAVVVLDEATSHLDSETELLVQQALAEALAGRTSLVIAHRLSTIVAADQILVVDGGRVVEQGRHDDLVDAGGLYSELYRTQYLRNALEPLGGEFS
jgi:ATP-binding cassette subfamily B protein